MISLTDGSVRFLPYNVDLTLFWRLGHVSDGIAIALP
jgi:hypothetical protein